jgi:hypothetical protein
MTLKIFRVAVLASFLVLTAVSGYAAPIQGVLNIFGNVLVGQTTVDWTPPVGGPDGSFLVGLGNTGDFAAVPPLTMGTQQDLDGTVTPANTPINVAPYLTLASLPNAVFDLRFIFGGVFGPGQCFAAPAVGQSCTPPFPPPISPLNLTNTQTGSTASFSVKGIVTNTNTGEESDFTGVYTAQFNVPYQTLLTTVIGGGQVPATYSGTFTVVPIPEPGTEALAIGSLLVLAGLAFRRGTRQVGKPTH